MAEQDGVALAEIEIGNVDAVDRHGLRDMGTPARTSPRIVTPAEAGVQFSCSFARRIPAFAGMTHGAALGRDVSARSRPLAWLARRRPSAPPSAPSRRRAPRSGGCVRGKRRTPPTALPASGDPPRAAAPRNTRRSRSFRPFRASLRRPRRFSFSSDSASAVSWSMVSSTSQSCHSPLSKSLRTGAFSDKSPASRRFMETTSSS